ncbi:MAG: hypothetical protein M1484_02930 [Patescibacteria group bacterium]|nr:hypothetical protein [Patescibacteria group bacterium]
MEEERKTRVHDLLAWKSLNRSRQQYSKEVFAAFGAVAFLVSVVLMFFQEWLAILVTWAAFFLFYALTKIEPVEVEHKITTEGIISMSHAYLWTELGPFWFSQRQEELTLHVAHRNIFGQLMILVDKAQQEKIRDILAQYLPFIEVPEKSVVEKMSDWFSKKFPVTPKRS